MTTEAYSDEDELWDEDGDWEDCPPATVAADNHDSTSKPSAAATGTATAGAADAEQSALLHVDDVVARTTATCPPRSSQSHVVAAAALPSSNADAVTHMYRGTVKRLRDETDYVGPPLAGDARAVRLRVRTGFGLNKPHVRLNAHTLVKLSQKLQSEDATPADGESVSACPRGRGGRSSSWRSGCDEDENQVSGQHHLHEGSRSTGTGGRSAAVLAAAVVAAPGPKLDDAEEGDLLVAYQAPEDRQKPADNQLVDYTYSDFAEHFTAKALSNHLQAAQRSEDVVKVRERIGGAMIAYSTASMITEFKETQEKHVQKTARNMVTSNTNFGGALGGATGINAKKFMGASSTKDNQKRPRGTRKSLSSSPNIPPQPGTSEYMDRLREDAERKKKFVRSTRLWKHASNLLQRHGAVRKLLRMEKAGRLPREFTLKRFGKLRKKNLAAVERVGEELPIAWAMVRRKVEEVEEVELVPVFRSLLLHQVGDQSVPQQFRKLMAAEMALASNQKLVAEEAKHDSELQENLDLNNFCDNEQSISSGHCAPTRSEAPAELQPPPATPSSPAHDEVDPDDTLDDLWNSDDKHDTVSMKSESFTTEPILQKTATTFPFEYNSTGLDLKHQAYYSAAHAKILLSKLEKRRKLDFKKFEKHALAKWKIKITERTEGINAVHAYSSTHGLCWQRDHAYDGGGGASGASWMGVRNESCGADKGDEVDFQDDEVLPGAHEEGGAEAPAVPVIVAEDAAAGAAEQGEDGGEGGGAMNAAGKAGGRRREPLSDSEAEEIDSDDHDADGDLSDSSMSSSSTEDGFRGSGAKKPKLGKRARAAKQKRREEKEASKKKRRIEEELAKIPTDQLSADIAAAGRRLRWAEANFYPAATTSDSDRERVVDLKAVLGEAESSYRTTLSRKHDAALLPEAYFGGVNVLAETETSCAEPPATTADVVGPGEDLPFLPRPLTYAQALREALGNMQKRYRHLKRDACAKVEREERPTEDDHNTMRAVLGSESLTNKNRVDFTRTNEDRKKELLKLDHDTSRCHGFKPKGGAGQPVANMDPKLQKQLRKIETVLLRKIRENGNWATAHKILQWFPGFDTDKFPTALREYTKSLLQDYCTKTTQSKVVPGKAVFELKKEWQTQTAGEDGGRGRGRA